MKKNNYLEDVEFALIRYANCWEDADVLMKGLNPKPGSRIGSIASAGDNTFALLASDPQQIVAVDLSREQLFLTELKKIAIKNLERESYLRFIGIENSNGRQEVYNSISSQLSTACKKYWDNNLIAIRLGIIQNGKFEKYFHLFRRYILPLIHSKKEIRKLLEHKSAEVQKIYYNKTWNSWRWRLLFRIFFSRFVMGKFGRDPKFLEQVDIPVGEFIFQKAEDQLTSVKCQHNYFLSMMMLGNFGDILPFYLRKENFDRIRENIDRIEIRHGFLEDIFPEFGKFDYLNLSNIFEYMPLNNFKETGAAIHNGMNKGGTVAYWNLMVHRKLSDLMPKEFLELPFAEDLHKFDNGFFYRAFICESVQ